VKQTSRKRQAIEDADTRITDLTHKIDELTADITDKFTKQAEPDREREKMIKETATELNTNQLRTEQIIRTTAVEYETNQHLTDNMIDTLREKLTMIKTTVDEYNTKQLQTEEMIKTSAHKYKTEQLKTVSMIMTRINNLELTTKTLTYQPNNDPPPTERQERSQQDLITKIADLQLTNKSVSEQIDAMKTEIATSQVQLQRRAKEDGESYVKMAYRCETKFKGTAKAIAGAEAKIADITNKIDELTASSRQLQKKAAEDLGELRQYGGQV